MKEFLKLCDNKSDFIDIIDFTNEDVQRSEFVKYVLQLYNK